MKIDGEPLTFNAAEKARLVCEWCDCSYDGARGRLRGVTVSAFSSVSLNPPLALVCIANEAESKEWVAESGVFAVNILSDEQEFLSERFAARAPIVNTHFEGVPYHTAVTGSPILGRSWRGMTAAWKPRTRRRSYDLHRARGGGRVRSRGEVAVVVLCESVCGGEGLISADGLRDTVCHVVWPHCGHLSRRMCVARRLSSGCRPVPRWISRGLRGQPASQACDSACSGFSPTLRKYLLE